jgi:transmembrane sensor
LNYQDWYRSNPSINVPQEFGLTASAHKKRLFEQIQVGMATSKNTRVFNLKKFAAAAAVLILISSGVYLWLYNASTSSAIIARQQLPIVPGKEQATLTLSDGSVIVLDSTGAGKIGQQGNVEIIKSADGKVAYNSNGVSGNQVMMNTMSTPRGGKYQLKLPDGTNVWLNAASSITYPAVFTGTNRTVKITGEIYFEVTQNKQQPFIVNIDEKSSVEVLGTSFNVNSYTDEQMVKTTLLEGSVRINHSQILKPGQQSVFNNKNISINKPDIEQVMAWKNGYFNLDGLDIKTVMKQIERWYDVEVVYEGVIPMDKLMGELPMDASIEQVLRVLKKIQVHFRIEGRKIIVTP